MEKDKLSAYLLKSEPGFESLCYCERCVHNDRPECRIHTLQHPMIIGQDGRCADLMEKEEGRA